MMIKVEKPNGIYVGDRTIQYRFEQDNKYYIVDTAYNKYEISEVDYKKLTCPIKKFAKKVRV